MALVREIKRRARSIAPQAFMACLAVYFAYHAVQGDRGFLARIRLQQDLAEVQMLRAQAETERHELEQRVALLRPENLDPDMLEEQARTLLNFGRADEYMLYRDTQTND